MNAYLIEGDGLTLVDTGPRAERVHDALQSALADKGFHIADIEQVVVTHPHLDHFGLARRIVEESGARVLVHEHGISCLTDYEGERQRVADRAAACLRQTAAPEAAWTILRIRMSMYECFAESVPADCVRPLYGGEVLNLVGMPWQVLPTPGHCLGHISLFQADTGRLISGDCLLPDYGFIPVPNPVATQGTHSDLVGQWAQSLDLLGGLDIRQVLPGHGQAVDCASTLVARERANLATSREQLSAALADWRQTAYELWRACTESFQTFDVLTGIEVVTSYLYALQAEGAVNAWEEGNLVTYSRTN
jgi:glyoxylase-like metal-dependent hydrolase (beta-lactamase superfamily II)